MAWGTSYSAIDGPRATSYAAIRGDQLCCHGWSGGTAFGVDHFLCDSTCSRPQTYKRVWDDKEGKFKVK